MIDLSGLDAWRANVSKHRFAFALLAALVATHMATVNWYKIIGISTLGWPQFNGILLLVHPYGPLTKNLPMLAAIWLLYVLEKEEK